MNLLPLSHAGLKPLTNANVISKFAQCAEESDCVVDKSGKTREYPNSITVDNIVYELYLISGHEDDPINAERAAAIWSSQGFEVFYLEYKYAHFLLRCK